MNDEIDILEFVRNNGLEAAKLLDLVRDPEPGGYYRSHSGFVTIWGETDYKGLFVYPVELKKVLNVATSGNVDVLTKQNTQCTVDGSYVTVSVVGM